MSDGFQPYRHKRKRNLVFAAGLVVLVGYLRYSGIYAHDVLDFLRGVHDGFADGHG